MSLKLYHFPQSRSLRVLWALKELDIDCNIEVCLQSQTDLKGDAYRALNPLGKIPVFFDNDKRLVESTAIIQYLSDTHGNGQLSRNPGQSDYGDFLQWLHFGEAGMGGYVNQLIAQTALLAEKHRNPMMRAWAQAETKNCLNFLETNLTTQTYLLDKFSLADISVGYMLYLIDVTGNNALFDENVTVYYERLSQRPAWVYALSLK